MYCKRLVDNLLDMSRLEAGVLQLKYDWCDLHDLLNAAVNGLKKELSLHRVTLNIQKDIPLVKLDRGLFEQAVVNILHNASVHTPAGTSIMINASVLKDELVVCIRDNGPGLPNENPEKLVEKFYKAEIKKTGGLGLGLSIAHGFINAHKGEINIKNLQPNGVEFQLTIPVEKTQIKYLNE
jgi:two-component system sensor histidine kinase KdpD